MGNNPHKDMVRLVAWLKPEEARAIKSYLEVNMPTSIGLVIIEVDKRGDLK